MYNKDAPGFTPSQEKAILLSGWLMVPITILMLCQGLFSGHILGSPYMNGIIAVGGLWLACFSYAFLPRRFVWISALLGIGYTVGAVSYFYTNFVA